MGDIINCIINDFNRKSQSGGMNISRDMNSFLFSKYLHDFVPCGNTILKADGSVWSEENCPDDDVSRSVSFRRKQGLMGNSAIVITHRPRWEPRAANHTLSLHHLQTECLSRRDILFSCLSHRFSLPHPLSLRDLFVLQVSSGYLHVRGFLSLNIWIREELTDQK